MIVLFAFVIAILTLCAVVQILAVMREVYHRCGIPYLIFGDSAFPLNMHMQRMLKGRLDKESKCFNALMARHRICIENVFAEIYQNWGFTSHHLTHKLGSELVGEMYLVATLLQNCKACCEGNQMAAQFGMDLLCEMDLQRFLSVRNTPHYSGCA